MRIRDLAAQIDISSAHLSYIERGIRQPSHDKLVRIATALNVLPSDLRVVSDTPDFDSWRTRVAEIKDRAAPMLLFGRRLRKLRHDRNLTLEDLAARSGTIQLWQVRQFEVQGRQPTPGELESLSTAFACSSTQEFLTLLDGVDLEMETEFDTPAGKTSIARGFTRALRSLNLEPELLMSSPVLTSRSIDGDLLVRFSPLFARSTVRLVRPSGSEFSLCLVFVQEHPAALGRMTSGVVIDLNGSPAIGDVWQIESILFPESLF